MKEDLLEELSEAGRRLASQGYVSAAGGNISLRADDQAMLISPSGYALNELRSDSFVSVNLLSGKVDGPLRPSSEWEMHLRIYQARPEIRYILHTHPIYCIAVSSTLERIPSMFPDFVVLANNLGYVEYMTPCTQQLAQAVSDRIANADAAVLRNHGLVTVGTTLREAYFKTQLVEDAARTYAISRMLGTPKLLSDEECGDILGLDAEQYRIQLLRHREENA